MSRQIPTLKDCANRPITGCERHAEAKGLCLKCYRAARRKAAKEAT